MPTGNFGNVLAGWIAQRTGAAISGFVLASNTNDILTRFIVTAALYAIGLFLALTLEPLAGRIGAAALARVS